MTVKSDVFGSNSERRNYYKLMRVWGGQYHLHHNLPFLNIFQGTVIFNLSEYPPKVEELTSFEYNRLKKTSIDYTLCTQDDKPLVCVDFDGLQDGISVGTRYLPGRPDSPWRQEITDLKLRVALGNNFPYFVVGTQYFQDLSSDVRLTIVDAIIGEVLAGRAAQERYAKGLDTREIGFTQEEWDRLDADFQQEMVQDWVDGVDIDAQARHNPIFTAVAKLSMELGSPVDSWEGLQYPSSVPWDKASLIGSKCTVKAPGHEAITKTAWIPMLRMPYCSTGLGLADQIAEFLALQELKRRMGKV